MIITTQLNYLYLWRGCWISRIFVYIFFFGVYTVGTLVILGFYFIIETIGGLMSCYHTRNKSPEYSIFIDRIESIDKITEQINGSNKVLSKCDFIVYLQSFTYNI